MSSRIESDTERVFHSPRNRFSLPPIGGDVDRLNVDAGDDGGGGGGDRHFFARPPLPPREERPLAFGFGEACGCLLGAVAEAEGGRKFADPLGAA